MTSATSKQPASIETLARKWRTDDPERMIGRGHPVGDFLEAYDWKVLGERVGFLRLACHLPDQVRNPRGELFGGFTPTYADLVAVFTGRAGRRQETPRSWLSTASLRVDYFAPIDGDFIIESEVLHRTGRTQHVQIRFLAEGERLLAICHATIIEQKSEGEA
ncbi:MAG: PaaI family thioesterase [Deltaproteobacteria bacterium]|nr:PaaI family thioesterase [Deltaproteobacteria bacterium]